MTIKTKKYAAEITGSLGNPSKMPGKSYGIPAAECHTGSKLRGVPGSVCSHCYALKGRYAFDNVSKAQYRRFDSLDDPLWVMGMAKQLEGETWFRWHDAGDLQSVTHLAKICMVAALTPKVNHWLPTREKSMVAQYLRNGGVIPGNLTIRVSAAMIDGPAPSVPEGCNTSTVVSDKLLSRDKSPASANVGHVCPAREQGNECGSCRACWDRNVPNVAYHIH